MSIREFSEYPNPEEQNYDVTSLPNSSPQDVKHQGDGGKAYWREKLIEVM